MNKICTSLEQSKKLIKLGIDLKTADMYWHKKFDGTLSLRADNLMVKLDTPCWSLAALLGTMPSVIKRKGKRMFLTLEKAGAYNLYYKSPDRLDELWETKEEPVDACYEMIELLHKENLI